MPHTKERTPNMERAANRGTAIHKYLQDKYMGATELAGYYDELKLVPVTEAAGDRVPLHHKEVAFSYDVETGKARELDCDGRDYGELKETEIPGTADVIIPGFQTLEVWDYKTGKTPVSPVENAQLLHAALCAAKVYAPQARYFLLGIQTLKRTPQDLGKPAKKLWWQSDSWLADSWTLEGYQAQLKTALASANEARDAVQAGKEPKVNPGKQCWYCPAKPSCPAMRNKCN